MDVGELVASLRVNLAEFKTGFDQARSVATAGMNGVASAVEASSGKASKAMQDMASSTSSAASDMAGGIRNGPKKALTEVEEEAKRVTWNVRGYLKDTGRVVTGILIAQGFYKILNSVESSIKAMFAFNNQLQQSEIAFEKMLGSSQAAKSFMNDLQDLAATTPFSYETAQRAAQNLLNVGWAADKVIPTLRTVIDAASLRGASPDVIDGIVLALGQIANKGRISAEELNQLAERGIPAYQILRKELNLDAKAMQNIGKDGITAEKGIEAILRGIDKYAGGTSEKVAKTTGGLISSIKDNLLIAGNTAFAPIFKGIHDGLASVDSTVTRLRQAGRKGGTGGIFEAIFPPGVRGQIRTIIAAFESLTSSIGQILKAIWPVIETVGGMLLQAFAIVLPVVATVVKVFADLVSWLLQSTPLVRAITLAIVGLLVTTYAAAAVQGLVLALRGFLLLGWLPTLIRSIGMAIRFMALSFTASPIGAVITAIAIALIGLAMSSKVVSQWLETVTQQIANLGGMKIDKVLQPQDDQAAMLEHYTNMLKDTTNQYGDMGDAAKGATKAQKDFIASFDEVFNMKDHAAAAAGGLGGGGGGGGGGGTTPPGGTPPGSTFDPTGGTKLPPVIMLPKLMWPDGGGPTAVATVMDLSMNQIRAAVKAAEAETVPSFGRIAVAADAMGAKVGTTAPAVNVAMDDIRAGVTATEPVVVPSLGRVGVAADGMGARFPVAGGAFVQMWRDMQTANDTTAPAITSRWEIFKSMIDSLNPILASVRENWSLTMNHLLAELTAVAPPLTVLWLAWNATLLSNLPVMAQIRTDWHSTLDYMQVQLNAYLPYLIFGWLLLTQSFASVIPILDSIIVHFHLMLESMKKDMEVYSPSIIAMLAALLVPLFDLRTDLAKTSEAWSTAMASMQARITLATAPILVQLQAIQQAWATTMAMIGQAVTIPVITMPEIRLPDMSKIGASIKTWWEGVQTALNPGTSMTDPTRGGAWKAIDNLGSTLDPVSDFLRGVIIPGASGAGAVDSGAAAAATAMAKVRALLDALKNSGGLGNAVPGFAGGGIISRDSLIRAGEGNKREAIIPLQNGNAMQPFADAVANALGANIGVSTSNEYVTINAGVLIADRAGLKELERTLATFRQTEGSRGSNA